MNSALQKSSRAARISIDTDRVQLCATLVAAAPRCAVSPIWNRQGVRPDRARDVSVGSAERNSAIQQITNLRDDSFSRRDFLKTAVAMMGVAALEIIEGGQIQSAVSMGFIDANVNLSRWPLRRLHGDDTAGLVAMLRRQGVVQAWAGSFDGLMHKDIASVNARLAYECHRHGRGLLLPFGSINPKLPKGDRKSTRLNSSHLVISYAVLCLNNNN